MEPRTGMRTPSVSAARNPSVISSSPRDAARLRRAGRLSARTIVPASSSSPRDAAGLRRAGRLSARTTLGALPHDLAQESLGPEDQDQDQDGEREDVLVLSAEGPAREQRQVRRGERFQ